jgi:dye decolorizing peroxidase
VTTPPQSFAAWVGLTLADGADRDACRRLMSVLTDDIDRLMRGSAPLTDLEPELAAVPASLTVTVAVGPGFYAAAGLGAVQPPWLAPLPRFPIDRLEERWGQSDLVLQICSDSPVTVAHAQRRLVVGAQPIVSTAWVQRGFREPLTRQTPGMPFRNLFGQVDGTIQPSTGGADDSLIWLGADAPKGLRNGSSMVIRRIAMRLDAWDKADRVAREHAVGRRLSDGAPLTGQRETDPPDLLAKDPLGFPVIDPASHLRRAMPVEGHERILRRPYSYDDVPGEGSDSDSGLVFVSFQADPVRQFVPIQRRLAEADLLNIWTVPVGSAVYAVLPGARAGEILGQDLLGVT